LPAPDAVKLLKQYKIPATDARLAVTAKEAAVLAKKFGKPVALKIASADISHKTDVGGVRLNVERKDVVKVFGSMMRSVKAKVRKAKLDGLTVSPMAKPGGVEVIIGVITDPQYGPAMMFGLGGIFTEIYKDVQFCLLPAKEREFTEMIRGITGYLVLAGARGQKPKDLKALIGIMKALSKLVMDHPEIDQIDLNPVIVYEKGAVVVDYRILTVEGTGA